MKDYEVCRPNYQVESESYTGMHSRTYLKK